MYIDPQHWSKGWISRLNPFRKYSHMFRFRTLDTEHEAERLCDTCCGQQNLYKQPDMRGQVLVWEYWWRFNRLVVAFYRPVLLWHRTKQPMNTLDPISWKACRNRVLSVITSAVSCAKIPKLSASSHAGPLLPPLLIKLLLYKFHN